MYDLIMTMYDIQTFHHNAYLTTVKYINPYNGTLYIHKECLRAR